LHDDKKTFNDLIEECNEKTKVTKAMIEKDYFVTTFLKRLFEAEPNVVFEGGTCLSKCYRLIDRFSEDIDLTMRPDATQKQKKGLKYHIIEVASELGLTHTNADTIDSGRPYGKHVIAYPANFISRSLKPFLLVETFYRRTPLPTLTLPASSMLYEYLKEEGADELISKFDLEPFDVTVQALQVTLIDKLYALNSNYLKGRVDGYSRHLYDIHRILPQIRFDGELFRLLTEVGKHQRKELAGLKHPIDFDPTGLPASLRKIISEDVYKPKFCACK
jgi:hypothetical protein